MGLFNNLFGSTEATAREIQEDSESLRKKWKDYLATVPKKKALVGKLQRDFTFRNTLLEIKALLILELADIYDEEKDEDELISDLEKLQHDQKIKRVHRMEDCLRYFDTRHEYVYELLRHLHSILTTQMHIIEKLLDNQHVDKFLSHLQSQVALEQEILQKIEDLETFHEIFLALVKGEHIIRKMDAGEKRLLTKMEQYMRGARITKKGAIYAWIETVKSFIGDTFRELEAQGILENHPDVDLELVNRPEFIDIVRESSQKIGKNVSEQLITVFVHAFREWYNHERD